LYRFLTAARKRYGIQLSEQRPAGGWTEVWAAERTSSDCHAIARCAEPTRGYMGLLT